MVLSVTKAVALLLLAAAALPAEGLAFAGRRFLFTSGKTALRSLPPRTSAFLTHTPLTSCPRQWTSRCSATPFRLASTGPLKDGGLTVFDFARDLKLAESDSLTDGGVCLLQPYCSVETKFSDVMKEEVDKSLSDVLSIYFDEMASGGGSLLERAHFRRMLQMTTNMAECMIELGVADAEDILPVLESECEACPMSTLLNIALRSANKFDGDMSLAATNLPSISTLPTTSGYTALSEEKIERYVNEEREALGLSAAEVGVEMTHAGMDDAVVEVGMFVEGTVTFKGCMCDIGVNQKAKTAGEIVLAGVNAFLGEIDLTEKPTGSKAWINEQITRAQMAVRMVFPNFAPTDMEGVCSIDAMSTAKSNDKAVPLSSYMGERTGDCRMNNILLSLLLEPLEKAGHIRDVKYRNRKWGITSTSRKLDVGDPSDRAKKWEERAEDTLYGQKSQGEHTLLQFKYNGDDTIYSLDAYARQHDRIPLTAIEKSGVVVDETAGRDWYEYTDLSVTGVEHNPAKRLQDSGLLEILLPKMSVDSKAQFEHQTRVGSGDDDMSYFLAEREQYPKIGYPTVA